MHLARNRTVENQKGFVAARHDIAVKRERLFSFVFDTNLKDVAATICCNFEMKKEAPHPVGTSFVSYNSFLFQNFRRATFGCYRQALATVPFKKCRQSQLYAIQLLPSGFKSSISLCMLPVSLLPVPRHKR